MNKALTYILVNSNRQAEMVGNSRKACLEYAMLHGLRGFEIEIFY